MTPGSHVPTALLAILLLLALVAAGAAIVLVAGRF